MATDLIVLIAVAGQNTRLEHTLRSLAKCYLPDNYAGTLVVENGPKFSAEATVRSYAQVLRATYLYHVQGNKSNALSYALQHLSDDTLVFFTDDDITFDTNLLLVYAEANLPRSEKCFYGGAMSVTYEEKPPPWLVEVLPPSARGWKAGKNDDYRSTPRFLGCNWAAYAGDIKALGGFNKNLGPGTKPKRTGQEWEMQERLLAKGYTPIYLEKALVWHHVPKSRSSFGWFIKRRFQGGLGVGISFVEKNGKKKFPLDLIKHIVKACLLLPVYLLLLSRTKVAAGFGNISSGLGIIKGYLSAFFSSSV